MDSLGSSHRGKLSSRWPHASEAEQKVLDVARKALSLEARALEQLASRIDASFCRAVSLLAGCTGRVVVSGMGKSGHVGRKIAATFASSGTPAFFLHPAEAAHGDLGMVTEDDTVILVSRSGETAELRWLLPHFAELGLPILAILGEPRSAIAQAAHVVLDVSVEREACPHGRVPTTSALASMAMGDALAVAVMRRKGITAEDVAHIHPGCPGSGARPPEPVRPAAGISPVRAIGRGRVG